MCLLKMYPNLGHYPRRPMEVALGPPSVVHGAQSPMHPVNLSKVSLVVGTGTA